MTRTYALAWLPYLGAYVLVFRMSGFSVGDSASGALANVLPEAVLGVIPLRHAIQSASRPASSGVLAALRWRHAALALVFVTAATLGKMVLLLLERAVERGAWTYDPITIASRAGLDVLITWHRLLTGGDVRPLYDPGILVWQTFFALLVYGVLASVGHAVGTRQRLRAEEERATRAEMLRARAEAQALRSQLNPHFLFNTLHSLLSLIRVEPERAERALEQFGDLMRYSLRAYESGAEEVRLREEMGFVDTYLQLEALRLGDRLHVIRELDPDVMDEVVPAFCLQPLVENAILHAVAPRTAATTVRIGARRGEGVLVLEVADDGPGARADGFADGAPETRRSSGSKLGLRLVRERLRTLRGTSAELSVHTAPGAGFRAMIVLPLDARNGDDA